MHPPDAAMALSTLFCAVLVVTLMIRTWLATRQIRHVLAHRAAVPAAFATRIDLATHQRAADYTVARVRLGLLDASLGTAVLLGWTLLGGLQSLHAGIASIWPEPSLTRDVALALAVSAIGGFVDLPLSWWRQFHLEARFGFNRMTTRLWLVDQAKSALVGALLGAPLVATVLALMRAAGPLWWLQAWVVLMGFNIFMLVAFPVFIAPLFNKFEPMPAGAARDRIEQLLKRCQFSVGGLFVMDGSRRSAHGNAYFTGIGRTRRIVFFDTLLERLAPAEIEAVLAHELGHFRCRHVTKRIGVMFALSLAALALLGWLASQTWFYRGLGVEALEDRSVMSLLLFMLALPPFAFLARPLMSLSSRRQEFEADRFAAAHAEASDLIAALVKLYRDNASTLTPDPLHSAFYDSHPPAAQRIEHLLTLGSRSTPDVVHP